MRPTIQATPPQTIYGKHVRPVKEAVEQVSHCVSILSLLQPLDTAERATVTMISDARRKYFYILAMSLKLQPGGNFVRVAPSKVRGLGVFAVRDIRKHTCFTVREGEELLMDYGERYWQERSQTGVKTKSRN